MLGPIAIACFAAICFGVAAVLLFIAKWLRESKLGEISRTLIAGVAVILLMTAAIFASTPFVFDAMAYYGLVDFPETPAKKCNDKLVQCYEFVGRAVDEGRLKQ